MFISLIKLICIYSYSLIINFFSFGQLGVNDDKGKIYIMSNYYFDSSNANIQGHHNEYIILITVIIYKQSLI